MKLKTHIGLGFFAFAGTLFLALTARAGLLNTGMLAPSAATEGMGGAHAALGGDAEDFILNPAVLARQQSLSLDIQGGSLFGSQQWLMGGTLASPAEESSVGLALGSQRIWTDQTQNFQQAWMLSMGVPLQEGGESGLGVTLRYFSSDYGDPGRNLGLDLGLLHRFSFGGATLAVAASVLDVDSVITYDSGAEERIPEVIKVGLALEWDPTLRLAMDNDFQDPGGSGSAEAQGQYTFHLGLEKSFWQGQVLARLGYIGISAENSPDPFGGNSQRPTLGLGLRYGRFHLDYAWLPSSGGEAATHRLGAQLDLFNPPKADQSVSEALQPLVMTKSMSGDKLALLAWNDPQARPGTSYVILMSLRPDAMFSRLAQTGGGQRSVELRGLENGRTYYFKVAAMDPDSRAMDMTLSQAAKLSPEAPTGLLAASLAGARDALERGNFPAARDLAEQALQTDPGNADADLMLQRLQRLNPKGAP
jgi:hypothetical protein